MSFFQQALQGVSGKPKLSAKQKAELSSAIADACMARVGLQGCEIDCAANNDPKTRGLLSVSLALSGTWGDSFRSARPGDHRRRLHIAGDSRESGV